MDDKIDMMIKYYEGLIEELEVDKNNIPSYLVKHEVIQSKINMVEEFISDLKGLKKEIQ
jgi:hypothetical protein